MIDITDKQSCCGCSSCVQKCPRQCISLHEDTEGFLYPVVDKGDYRLWTVRESMSFASLGRSTCSDGSAGCEE